MSPTIWGHSFLVASFGRCKFKLSPSSVGAIFQATIGGVASDFAVLQLGDRVFRFSVSSMFVGFHVVNLRSFECLAFKLFFHLWGKGDPNWIREWRNFCVEEEASWTDVRKNPQAGRSLFNGSPHSASAGNGPPLTGPNAVPIAPHQHRCSVFDLLFFPSDQSPAAHNGKKPIGQVHQARQKHLRLNLNFGAERASGQYSSAGNPSTALAPGICSRCLAKGHDREACKSSIKCFTCRRDGHIELNCPRDRF